MCNNIRCRYSFHNGTWRRRQMSLNDICMEISFYLSEIILHLYHEWLGPFHSGVLSWFSPCLLEKLNNFVNRAASNYVFIHLHCRGIESNYRRKKGLSLISILSLKLLDNFFCLSSLNWQPEKRKNTTYGTLETYTSTKSFPNACLMQDQHEVWCHGWAWLKCLHKLCEHVRSTFENCASK